MRLAMFILAAAMAQQQAPPPPQPFPRPSVQPARPGSQPTVQPAPPPEAPAVTTAPLAEKPPTDQTLGIPIYPGAQFIASYDAGRGQRFYIFGSAASFVDLVTFYRTTLKQKGDLLFDAPATHQFEVGRFREETMAFPAGVTIKEEIREGRTADRLLDFAAAHHIDLIVAGRQGMNALARLFVGSTTKTLLRSASCSLFIAPEPPLPDADRLERLLTGVAEVRKPESWTLQLDGFTRRNRGRVAKVEMDDLDLGAQVIESGFAFQGASYDERDERVELMLAGTGDLLQHVTRSIGGVKWVAIGTDPEGRDFALRIDHGTGQTLLTFTKA